MDGQIMSHDELRKQFTEGQLSSDQIKDLYGSSVLAAIQEALMGEHSPHYA